ncbi:MAG TPA: SusC/RagA family TonB-linked outer membrane protein [Puia sp.]|jgi:TonB-linked SusC/RagA family outer membrane protein|nr:SusC/RagA family TonB-linked outer membrane protein [Puia sp.]
MRKSITLLLLWGMLFKYTEAQQHNISGHIVSESGQPVAGATILAKGASGKGTSTDDKGNFTLSVPDNVKSIQISAVGFVTQTLDLVGRSSITVTLKASDQSLDQVVVTALGIKREVKTLGYAAQTVSADQLVEAHQTNLVNALQGKVAGVTISSAGGGPGQGASILIRGVNSLDPGRDPQPLFVIDGNVVDNSTSTLGTDGNRGTQMPNRISDINPDDIETVNILRGGAATALYGLRGANGVVVITTKSGKAGRLQVHYTTSYSTDVVDKLPALQMKYTMGFGGTLSDYDSTSFWPTWGPTVEQARTVDPNHPAKLYNNWKQAYGTGHQFRNSLSFSGGTDKATYSSSIAYSKNNGLIPFTFYTDITARLNGQLKFSDQFKMNSSLIYSNTDGNFYDADRYNEELIYWAPRYNVKDFAKPDGTMKTYGNGNPVYFAATNKFGSKVNHVTGSLNFTYQPLKWLTANYLIGIDQYGDARTATAPGPKGVPNEIIASDNDLGFVHEYQINNRNLTSTVSLTFDHTWADKFQTTLRVGNDIFDQVSKTVSAEGNNLDVYDLFTLANAKQTSISSTELDYRLVGFYGDLTLGYNNYLYLDLTGRNDRTSSLESGFNSFYYPSASLSYIFSQHLSMPSWITYGKFRASIAGIGKDAAPYSTSVVYSPSFNQPINGVIGWTRNANAGVQDLKPERTTTYEAGFDLNFLNNRLSLNATVYLSKSKDQILGVSVANSTGFNKITLNAGELQNKGIELTLKGTPVRTTKFSWDIGANISANRNKVLAIYPGLDEIVVSSQYGYSFATVTQKYIKGNSVGDLFGTPVSRYQDTKNPNYSDKNLPWLIGANGFPLLTPYSNQKILGNAFPKWIASLSNTFSYKSWSLFMLWDARLGLKKYDQFSNFLAAFGESAVTLNRDQTVVFKGVLADGTPNTKAVWLGQGKGPDGVDYGNGYYRNVYRGIAENFIEDAAWVRLRSVSLSYRLPSSLLGKTFIHDANLSFTGNNLIVITQYKGFDPESSSTPAGSTANGFAGFSYPALRSYWISLNLGL